MLLAAFFGALVSSMTHSPWLGLAAAIVAGVLSNALFALFTVYLATDQVVVGTAINLFALGLTGTLYRARLALNPNGFDAAKLPGGHGIDAVTVALLAAIPFVWFLLARTAWGLALRACGEYPKAAEASGFSVLKLRIGALLVGGLFAGLAGGYLSVGIAGSFAENMTAGQGFVAIAMVTFGRWRPVFVFLAALLIGFAESLQFRFQALGWHAPFQLMIALPYIVALAVLIFVGKGTVAPGSLGIAYRREE